MGTTAVKNIIGGGVCKLDGSSSDCAHRRGIACRPSFHEPSPKQVSLLIIYLCKMHRFRTLTFEILNRSM
jgi:hypothetical protein